MVLYTSNRKSLFLSHLSHLSSPRAAYEAGHGEKEAVWGGCSSPKGQVWELEKDKRRSDKTGHKHLPPLLKMFCCNLGQQKQISPRIKDHLKSDSPISTLTLLAQKGQSPRAGTWKPTHTHSSKLPGIARTAESNQLPNTGSSRFWCAKDHQCSFEQQLLVTVAPQSFILGK